jgi:hypothetical protein
MDVGNIVHPSRWGFSVPVSKGGFIKAPWCGFKVTSTGASLLTSDVLSWMLCVSSRQWPHSISHRF